MINLGYTLLKIDTIADRTKNFVGSTKHAVEKLKLLIEQFINSDIGCICLIEKVDNNDIEILTVAVATSDALLDALRIPRHNEEN